jgi:hypothetical protein
MIHRPKKPDDDDWQPAETTRWKDESYCLMTRPREVPAPTRHWLNLIKLAIRTLPIGWMDLFIHRVDFSPSRGGNSGFSIPPSLAGQVLES